MHMQIACSFWQWPNQKHRPCFRCRHYFGLLSLFGDCK